jgi:hypothetical protein
MRHPIVISLLALAAWTAPPAHADTLRCGSVLIEQGVTQDYVLEKCGEPDSRTISGVPIRARRLNGTTYVVGTTSQEIWVYKRNSGQFPAVLTFDGGFLRELEFRKEERN